MTNGGGSEFGPPPPPRVHFDEFFSAAVGLSVGSPAESDVWDLTKDLQPVEGPANHRCLVYDSDVEQLAVVIPFVRDCLENGARCIYVADEHQPAGVESALRAGGIDVAAARGRAR